MTKYINVQTWPWLAFLLSSSLILGALAFEHIGGYFPCQMCYWQRHAHKAVLVVSGLAILSPYLFKHRKFNKVFLTLIGFAFLVSFGLAFWHMGVEYKWWEGPKTCTAIPSDKDVNVNDIMNVLEGKTKLPSCSDAPWHLFTISMAGYNAIISGLAALLSFSVKDAHE